MITEIIFGGSIVLLGFLVLLWKLPLRITLRLLSFGFSLDLAITMIAFILHWGSFTGPMIAASAGVQCGFATWLLRKAIGYRDRAGYHVGHWNMLPRLNREPG